ncbi:hypothetical protein MD484_g1831, partial [Candolleomyces efflorescens]
MLAGAGELPEELSLAPLQYCEIETWVSFALTCKRFSRWFENRIFWISALKSTRHQRPIACPFHHDLSKCSLEELQDIGHRTMRLERNWSLPQPKLVGPVRSIPLERRYLDAIFQVPGTQLYLMHSRTEERLYCIDASKKDGKESSRLIAGPMLGAPKILDVSPGQDDDGMYSMGLLLGNLDQVATAIVIASLEYGLGEGKDEVKLSYRFQHSLEFGPGYWAIFMTREIVGVMVNPARAPEDRLEILAYNIASGDQTVIQTDIAVPRGQDVRSGTSIYDDDLFFLVESAGDSRLHRCPRSLLPTDDKLDHVNIRQFKGADDRHCVRTLWGSQGGVVESYTEGALSADPYYGVPAVSIHRHVLQIDDDEMAVEDESAREPMRSRMEVRFWTSSKEEPTNKGNVTTGDGTFQIELEDSASDEKPTLIPHSSSYVRGIVQETATIGGAAAGAWVLMLIPPSGRMAAMILDVGGELAPSPILSLVRFNKESKECTTHTLELPDVISMSDVYGLTIDDNCGQISLLDTHGSMHIVSYA